MLVFFPRLYRSIRYYGKLYVMVCLIPFSHPSRIRLHGLVTVLSCWKEEKTDGKNVLYTISSVIL